MKFHTKLYLFFAAVVILPLLVVTVAAAFLLRQSGSETYEARLESSLMAGTVLISQQAQALSEDLQSGLTENLAEALVARKGEAPRAGVLTALSASGGFDGALLLDESGGTLVSVGQTGMDAEPLVKASVDVGDTGLRVTALRKLDTEALESIFTSQGLDWSFLDRQGTVAAGTTVPGTAISGISSWQELSSTQGEGSATGTFEATVADREVQAAAIALPQEISSQEAVLLASVPLSEVTAASSRATQTGIILMLIVLALAGILGWLLTRNITYPLRELTSAVTTATSEELGGGYTAAGDEVGSLARSFGEMQEGVRKYISELEESKTQLLLALSYAGEILGSTTDRNRLMKTTAEAARLATGARGVWVELFDGESTAGPKSISTAVPRDFFSRELGERARQMAIDVAEGRVPAGNVQALDNGSDAIAYPLLQNKKVLGSLLAVFDAEHKPEESSKKILGSLANQAANAVENIYYGEQQQQMAITDPMTDLYNFRYIYDFIELELSKCRRYGRTLSLAILDLDDFKSVNDTFGHQAGDELLKAVAAVLSHGIRGADMVARYGGEEFVIVFPETTKEDAMVIVEKLREQIAGLSLPSFPRVHTTSCIGVASFPGDADDKQGLMGMADQALYQAKAAGKNRCVSA